MPRWFRWTFLGIGILLIGGSLFYFAHATWRASAAEDWPVAQGRVVATRVDISEHSDEDDTYVAYNPIVAYEFQAGGRTLRSERLFLGGVETYDYREDAEAFLAGFPVGAPVEVYYNPADPSDSAVIIEGPSWALFLLAGLGLVFFAVGWFVPVDEGSVRTAPQRRPTWLPRRPPRGPGG